MATKLQGGDPGAELVTFRVYSNEADAELAKAQLDAAGIDSYLSGDDCGGLRPALSWSNGIKLIVRADIAARAAEILGEENQNSE